jgi:hypothetical protein
VTITARRLGAGGPDGCTKHSHSCSSSGIDIGAPLIVERHRRSRLELVAGEIA